MARQRSVITRCRNCQIDSVHLDDRRYGWQLRITYLADEKAYLTHPCSGCGEWQMRHVDGQELHHLVHFGVPVDDLSLVEPGLERDTMPDPTVDELCHMFWIAYEATPETRQAVIQSAVDKILGRPEHPAAGA